MSGGTSATEGFLYQAIVSLELTLDAFGRQRQGSRVRPEGSDDLEIEQTVADVTRVTHVQIKKPKQDDHGARKREPWTLLPTLDDLLAPSYQRLRGNTDLQTWILGDPLNTASASLLGAGTNAPVAAKQEYTQAIYRLARLRTGMLSRVGKRPPKKLVRWKPSVCPSGILPIDHLCHACDGLKRAFSVDAAIVADLIAEAERVDQALPDILARIDVRGSYGEIDELRARAASRIATHYHISEDVARRTVLNNFRGFLDDVARQRGRWIEHDDLEVELLTVLVHTLPVAEPPDLPPRHLPRPRMIADWREGQASATTIVASSGVGKSTAARELFQTLRAADPDAAVLYAELRQDDSLHDLLVGLAFRLRRRGHTHVFTAATQAEGSEQALIERTADALLAVAEPIQLVIDFVHGRCGERVHVGLAELVRRLRGRGPRIFLFGRDDPLEPLGPTERATLAIRRIDAPGLHTDQFIDLARLYGHDDAAPLMKLHDVLSGGRHAGVILRDAVALFGLESPAAMLELVESGATDVAEAADRRIFNSLPPPLLDCATHLLCHSLPFTAEDAEHAFGELPVRATIARLREVGLLLAHADGAYEFHEKVRAGLLRESVPDTVHRAHQRLAVLTAHRGPPAAVVYHLEQAGDPEAARTHARNAVFSDGRSGLVEYARRHRLFSAEFLLTKAVPEAPHWWSALSLLHDLHDQQTGPALLAMVQASGDSPNHIWLLAINKAILRIASELFDQLLTYALTQKPQGHYYIHEETLLLAAKQVDLQPPPSFDGRFARETAEKHRLVPYLLLRPTAARVRIFIAYALATGSTGAPEFLRSADVCREFIRALPDNSLGRVLMNREFGFGPLAPVMWFARDGLVAAAHVLLRDANASAPDQDRALRVLTYFGDRGVSQYRDRVAPANVLLARVSTALVGDTSVLSDERTRFSEATRDPGDRMVALLVRAMLGDLDGQGPVVSPDDPDGRQVLVQLLLVSHMLPADLLVRLMPAFLDLGGRLEIFLPTLCTRLAEVAPDPAVTEQLLRILTVDDPGSIVAACHALRLHRSRHALPALRSRLTQQLPLVPTSMLLTTLLASHPLPAEIPAISWPTGLDYWRATFADRLRRADEVPWLIALVQDPSASWQGRRAAVAALGRMCDDDEFADIAIDILAQPMLLSHDDTSATATTHFLWWLEHERQHDGLRSTGSRFLGTRSDFVALFGELYQTGAQPPTCYHLNHIGAQCAGVLYDFVDAGRRTLPAQLDRLINSLGHGLVQAAAMHCLSRREQTWILEQVALLAHDPWTATRAAFERIRSPSEPASEWLEFMRNRHFAFDPQANAALRNVLKNAETPRVPSASKPRPTATRAATTPHSLQHEVGDVVQRIERGELFPARPCVLVGGTTKEFARLVTLLHPGNDRVVRLEPAPPSARMAAYDGKRFTHRGVREHQVSDASDWRKWLRIALIVANDDGHDIPWRPTVERAHGHVKLLFECLLARGDGGRVATLFDQCEELFGQGIRGKDFLYPLYKILDARIVPRIERYMWIGSVQDLTGLIYLAAHLDVPEVVPALGVLLRRVTECIAPTGVQRSAIDPNDPVFMSLSALLGSRRLPEVPAAPALIGRLCAAVRHTHTAFSLIGAMRRIPSCYINAEMERMHVINFIHMHVDRFTQIDGAADELFRQK